jgi:hypothetical protein
MKRLFALCIVIAWLGLIAGCSDNGLPMVPVRGKVTFAGGPPPKPGTITFMPMTVDVGLPRRPGTANFGTDGEFQVTSFRENDGLVAGTYQAAIECWMREPSASDPTTFERFNHVPKSYEPEPVVVNADADEVVVNLDVPKKK